MRPRPSKVRVAGSGTALILPVVTTCSPNPIAESKAKSVAQEKKANGKEVADPGKEKEGKDFVSKKEIESITDSVTKEVAIADAGSTVGATNNTIADTAAGIDTDSHRSASNFIHSASRGREARISR